MSRFKLLHEDRLLPPDKESRGIARQLYNEIKSLPIISPHGHTDPVWFAENRKFNNPYELLIAPDHYLIRMLYSKGIPLETLGIKKSGFDKRIDPRNCWREFAKFYYLFRGTPSRLWLDYVFEYIFHVNKQLDETTADDYYDTISEMLTQDAYRPRQLFDNFNIEFLATTESPVDTLEYHKSIYESDWKGHVVTSYRPDVVIDPEHESFQPSLEKFGEITGEDVYSWTGYLAAHRQRRNDFIAMGATSSDHGHPTVSTASLGIKEVQNLFNTIINNKFTPDEAEIFRSQMLTEMARMSLDDGLVMQVHPGSFRNHNNVIFNQFGRDKGADIPVKTTYTSALKPLLDLYGNERSLTVILFTLDESNYSRELAPLAGHYPCLRLGPAWWFHDSPEGMLRFREQTTETAGFYNTVGFNDDTRAFLSIPARHDVARRIDCHYLSRLVAEHRIREDEAYSIAKDLTYNLPKEAYRIKEGKTV